MTRIYLDTALLLDFRDGRSPPEMSGLFSCEDAQIVVSVSHTDDVVAADPIVDQWILDFGEQYASFVAVPGGLAPKIESEKFINNPDNEDPPQMLFAHAHEMILNYQSYFETKDLRGERKPWDKIRAQRKEQKELWAEAEDHTKKYMASNRSNKKKEETLERKPLDPDSKNVTSCDEDQWQEQRNAIIKQFKGKTPLLDPEQFESFSRARGIFDPNDIRAGVEYLNDIFQALVNDDREGLHSTNQKLEKICERIEPTTDPLRIGIGKRKHFFFQNFLASISDDQRRSLLVDVKKMEFLFRRWLRSPACLSSLVYREIAWELKKDPTTPTTPSTGPDLHHISLLPYIDVIFADKRIIQALSQAPGISPTLKKKCIRNSEFSTWIANYLEI